MDTPICSVCKQPVRLETAKADESGKAVHEDYYLQRLMAVAASPAVFGVGRMWEVFGELSDNPSQIRVFYDLPSALKWLNLESLPQKPLQPGRNTQNPRTSSDWCGSSTNR